MTPGMRRIPILERHDLVGRWARVPAARPATPVLVGLTDPTARVEVSAALVAAGCRIVLARSAAQAEPLLAAVDLVVADTRILGAQRPAAQQTLLSLPVLLLAGAAELTHEVQARLAVTAVVRAPHDVDDIVTIVRHVSRWGQP